MPTLLDCPGTESWQALLDLALLPEQVEDFERHLQSCPACQERLDRGKEDEDALLRLARQVGDPTVATADSTLQQFLERLQEAKFTDSTAPENPIDLYFLHPSDRSDVLGTLGAYEVQEVIGQGGMGVVLKAFDPALNRVAAIKVMAAAVAGSAMARRRFAREAQAAAAVCHEHIVTVHGVHEADGLPYLVMQYIAGESLQDRLDRCGPMEVEEVVRIGWQTAMGLAAAHSQGLIHRDIKPANLLLEAPSPLPPTPPPRSGEGGASPPAPPLRLGEGAGGRGEGGRVKITDFGLARMIDDVQLTQNGVVAGTPEYMAPEQARGEAVDHRADLFSLGSVLYAMCTGMPPFCGSTAVAVLRQVSDQDPTPVRTLNPDVPVWLEAVIARLMAKDPADRFGSAAEVAGLLEGCLAHLRQPAAVPVPNLPFPLANDGSCPATRGVVKKWSQRLAWPGLLLLAAVGLLVFFQPPLPPEQRPAPKPPPPATVYQDFRGSRPLLPSLKLIGPDVETAARPEEGGLRITLPATRSVHQPVSVAPTVRLSGDFEITGRYELLSADRPAKGYGVGVSLSVANSDARDTFAKVARFLRAEEGSGYAAEYWNKGPPKDPWQFKWAPTEALTGQLRLVRSGAALRFLTADGPGNEFRELHRRKFTTADLAQVRFEVCDSGSPGNAVDARLVELTIRSGQLIPDSAPDDAPPQEEVGKPASRGWMPAVLLGLGVVLAFAIGLGAWRAMRQGRAEPSATDAKVPDRPAQTPSPGPAVSFACPACGKNLKARAELAGRKVKCSKCGQAALVPEA